MHVGAWLLFTLKLAFDGHDSYVIRVFTLFAAAGTCMNIVVKVWRARCFGETVMRFGDTFLCGRIPHTYRVRLEQMDLYIYI